MLSSSCLAEAIPAKLNGTCQEKFGTKMVSCSCSNRCAHVILLEQEKTFKVTASGARYKDRLRPCLTCLRISSFPPKA